MKISGRASNERITHAIKLTKRKTEKSEMDF